MKINHLSLVLLSILLTSFSLPSLELRLLDLDARIYTDSFPVSGSSSQPVHVPRNYHLRFQLALRSRLNTRAMLRLTGFKNEQQKYFKGQLRVKALLPVHVEGNTQGSLINRADGPTPDSWKPYFVRVAPFDVFEAVQDFQSNAIDLDNGKIAAALLEIEIPAKCAPGMYTGNLVIEANSNTQAIPVSFMVYETILPKEMALHSVHWLSENPENLTSSHVPAWWSEAHWALLERAGRQLLEHGDNMMYTPLINTANPLIQTRIDSQQHISFDYSKFDRWVKMFQKLGFKYFDGQHLSVLDRNLFFKDMQRGTTVKFGDLGTGMDWFSFLPVFLKDFNKHLQKIGLEDKYVQHLYDEPGDLEKYKKYSALLKLYMPGTMSIDAINSKPSLFSELVDMQVFNLTGINLQRDKVVKDRLASGKEVWLYNCTSPYPPYPNRHLDLPLTENRLWPLLCYKYGANGYLWWAANLYRGVSDEFRASLGPSPNGKPVHPPGDNWFYYRSKNGLIPSLRIISYKEGLIDVTLLRSLAKKDPNSAAELMSRLIHPEIESGHDRPFKDYLKTADVIKKGYETAPSIFYNVRADILKRLAPLD